MRGGQWQVLYLLRGLRDRGQELKLLGRRGGELLSRASAEGFDASELSLPEFLEQRGWGDVIHAHDASSHTLASLPGRRTPLVVSRRVAFAIRTGLASRWKYRQASHYIAISQFVAERLREAGIKSRAISVVYDGVPQDRARETPTQGLVVAPATADPMKGSDLAREAAQLAGAGIVFSTDLSKDLERAAMFLYITRSEGLGSAALLAMAHGVPVIASRLEGLMEVVEDEKTGLLVENTPAAIGSAIHRLLDRPEDAVQMGRAGFDRAATVFSLDRMVEETIQVYEKIQP